MKENVENLKGKSFSFLNVKISSLYQCFFKIILVIIFSISLFFELMKILQKVLLCVSIGLRGADNIPHSCKPEQNQAEQQTVPHLQGESQ